MAEGEDEIILPSGTQDPQGCAHSPRLSALPLSPLLAPDTPR